MVNKKQDFQYDVYSSIDELAEADAALLKKARESTTLAYAPYSKFNVGAAALLTDGNIVVGSNQENASYPAGICAERVLLSTASSNHSKVPIDTMAVSYNNENGSSDKPVSPCGICRQVLVEYEQLLGHPIRMILSGMEGEVFVIQRAGMLLPLGFTSKDMVG